VRRLGAEKVVDTDGWTIGLIRDVAAVDPEFAWSFVRELVEAAPDQEWEVLGASDLEDFCQVASEEFLDRIETAAAEHGKFRRALGNVWQGGLPDQVYQRISLAAGRPGA
jgi:hypothetical protein